MPEISEANSVLLPLRALEPGRARSERALRNSSAEAYAKDVQLYLRAGGTIPCDAADVLRYVEVMRTRLAARTLYRRLMAIQHAHAVAGHASPLADSKTRLVVRWLQAGKLPPKSLKAIESGEVPRRPRATRRAKPITRQLLERILDAVHRTSIDHRDRALLLLAFVGALKRSEVVAIDVDDLRWTADAMIVTIDGSEEPQARRLAVPQTGGELCAATALRSYVQHLQLDPGTPVFRSFNRASEPTSKRLAAAFVSEVLKSRMRVVGLDPTGYSAESLCVGRRMEVAKGVL